MMKMLSIVKLYVKVVCTSWGKDGWVKKINTLIGKSFGNVIYNYLIVFVFRVCIFRLFVCRSFCVHNSLEYIKLRCFGF